MNSRPSISRPRLILISTLLALLFAIGSVAWSALSIRRQVAERRLEEAREERLARWNRGPAPEPESGPKPERALAAFHTRRPTAALNDAASLFNITNVWTVHLRFTPDQWASIEPRQIETVERWRGSGGRFDLRNPAARRNGLAGVRGLEFEWVHAAVEFEDRTFADAAVRYKGNGTFMRSQGMDKRPFKVDLNKFTKGADVAGRTTLNFANLVVDDSCLHDAMGYEVFRAAGVPAPRTAYARLFLTVGTNAPAPDYLGVYALVENLDEDFAAERFGTRKGVFFKPVTTDLFSDLGDNWSAYDGIYDPKSKPTPAQTDRVIEFARLLTHADDGTFGARADEFIELDEFARFLAGMVMLSSYDGFLNNGQNFYVWLSPDTRKFHFLPWDLDNAWGKFGWAGSAADRANASIMHPWIGRHRLLERIMAVPDFEARYRKALGELLSNVFVPERLHRRVDELAALLRPVVAEESERKSSRFETAVTAAGPVDMYDDSPGFGRNRPPHPLKWFITERARSVREQFAGESEGVRPERGR